MMEFVFVLGMFCMKCLYSFGRHSLEMIWWLARYGNTQFFCLYRGYSPDRVPVLSYLKTDRKIYAVIYSKYQVLCKS